MREGRGGIFEKIKKDVTEGIETIGNKIIALRVDMSTPFKKHQNGTFDQSAEIKPLPTVSRQNYEADCKSAMQS